MKSALVYYSRTGNTESVAKRFENMDYLRVEAKSDDPYQKEVTLTNIPDITGYDHVIFASPVHGFKLSSVMKAYINQLGDLSGKTIDTFVTHYFRFYWMGGSQALKRMRELIEKKGGEVRYETSINWKSSKRQKDILDMIERYQK